MSKRLGIWVWMWIGLCAGCVGGAPPKEPPADAGPPETRRTETGATDVPEPSRCIANNDGVIELGEVPFVVGASLAVRQNKDGSVITINHTGKEDASGKLLWDFTLADTPTRAQVKTVEPTGQWFFGTFPQANLLTPVLYRGFTGVFYQVLRLGKDALFLEGIASQKEKPEKDKVLLSYETPVPLLRFPLRLGKEWVVTAKSKGTVGGLPLTSTDTYHVRVTHRGALKLPDIQFENTLRIEYVVRQTLLGGQKRQFFQILYFHECFGEIARVESKEGETDANFTQARLVRYISF